MNITKTGTTIVGLKYSTGVVLCADTRATAGPIVADKNCNKIHYIADTIRCCGAGTAADTEWVTRRMSKELLRFKMRFMREPYVSHAERLVTDYLHGYQGQIGAALILGGVDVNGTHLHLISPHGYSAELEFTSLGSGSLAAIAELEARFRKGMAQEEAIELGVSAVKKGILNDLYSGSNVDVCVIDEDGSVRDYRNHLIVETAKNDLKIVYPSTSLTVVKESITELANEQNIF